MFVIDGLMEHSLQAIAAMCFAESKWMCVCPFVVAMRVWLLWCVAALHWKWLANVAKFLVAPKEVGSRFAPGKVLDPVALARKQKARHGTKVKAAGSESNTVEYSWCAWAAKEKTYSLDFLSNVETLLQN